MAITDPGAGKMIRHTTGQRAARLDEPMIVETCLRSALAALGHVRAVLDQRCEQDNGGTAPGLTRVATNGRHPAADRSVTVTFVAPNEGATGTSGIVGFQGSSAYLEPLIRICSGWIIVLR